MDIGGLVPERCWRFDRAVRLRVVFFLRHLEGQAHHLSMQRWWRGLFQMMLLRSATAVVSWGSTRSLLSAAFCSRRLRCAAAHCLHCLRCLSGMFFSPPNHGTMPLRCGLLCNGKETKGWLTLVVLRPAVPWCWEGWQVPLLEKVWPVVVVLAPAIF